MTASRTDSSALEQAADAAIDGDAAGALQHLLVAWRVKRCVRIAEVIDRVSAVASAKLPSLVAKPQHVQWERWNEVARRQQAIDFDRLAAVPMPRRHDVALFLLDELYRWPPDPRFARMLARMISEVTFNPRYREPFRDTVNHFYERMMHELVVLGDRRALVALEDTTHRELRYGQWRAERPKYAARLRAVVEPELDAGELEVLAELEAMYPAEQPDPKVAVTLEELIAAVYERPDDLGARTVWGDLLVERGDPRGEFVALQLAEHRDPEASRKREARLLATHGEQWTGPAGGWFDDEDRVFEGGLFAGGKLSMFRRDIPASALDDPAWRVVRAIHVQHASFAIATLDHPNLAWLRRIRIPATLLADLAAQPRPLVELAIENRPGTDFTPLVAAPAFPALRRLGLYGFENLMWVCKAPVLARLEHLIVGLYPTSFSPWWKRLNDSPLPSVSVNASFDGLAVDRGWEFRFTRDRRGKLGALRCTLHYRPGLSTIEIRDGLVAFFELLEPEGLLTSVAIDKSTTTLKIPKAPVLEALARFRSLADRQLPW